MNSRELQSILTAAGISCTEKGQEVVLDVCVFCGNERRNLELNAERGVFHSWCCKRGGRLDSLLKTLTGNEHRITVQKGQAKQQPKAVVASEFQSKPVGEVQSAANYLARRGITPEIATQYGLVVCTDPAHRLNGRIAIPARDFWTGEVAGWVGRTYTGRTPKYLSTLSRKVITGWRQRNQHATVVVAEGPLDGLAVHLAGYQAAVLGGVGDAGVLEWASRLTPQTRIVIMLDPEAFQQAHQLFWEIVPVRSAPVVVAFLEPGTDPASLGAKGVKAAVEQALETKFS